VWYNWSMNTDAGGTGVECRLTINGVTIEFKLDGPLVALAPAPETAKKKTSKRKGT